jgi:hypothetical protein
MDIRPIFFKEIGFHDFLGEWFRWVIAKSSGFGKEEPETRLFLPKAGLMSIFADSN